ncbi:MAG: DUF3179 domain-containing (seleno)protein [Vicinamibacterales bacterium]
MTPAVSLVAASWIGVFAMFGVHWLSFKGNSINAPAFVSAAEARLHTGDPVIGIHHNGEARAYPHRIMVHHEIVNDRVGGLNLAVTYCPLTATAQGFKRGDTALGVSGQLLNSNLVLAASGHRRATAPPRPCVAPRLALLRRRGEHAHSSCSWLDEAGQNGGACAAIRHHRDPVRVNEADGSSVAIG